MDDIMSPGLDAVREFLDRSRQLRPDELTRLRQEAKHTRSRVARQLDPALLSAVTTGDWGAPQRVVLREIRAEARARARDLVPWPRRAALARVLEDAALVVLNEADPQHPLPEQLCRQLAEPWERATRQSVRRSVKSSF